MNKKMLALTAILSASLAGCATYDTGYSSSSSYNGYNNGYRQSQPWSASDEGRYFNDGSRVVCQNYEVQRNSRDPDRVGGTIAGAVIGGIIGNQIGSGSGRAAATAVGAVAGGAVGRNLQGNRQEARGDRIVERRCERVWR